MPGFLGQFNSFCFPAGGGILRLEWAVRIQGLWQIGGLAPHPGAFTKSIANNRGAADL